MSAAIQLENAHNVTFVRSRFRGYPVILSADNVHDIRFVDTEVDNDSPSVLPGDLDSLVTYLGWLGMPEDQQRTFRRNVSQVPVASRRASLTRWLKALGATGLSTAQVVNAAAAVHAFLR